MRWLGFLSSVLLAGGAWFAGALPGGHRESPHVLGLVVCLIGLAGLVGCWLRVSSAAESPRRLLITGVLWQIPLLLAPPIGSRDVYSYACQGWTYARSLDPYLTSPRAADCPWLPGVATLWQDATTPYGPFALLVSGAAGAAGSWPVALVVLRVCALAGLALAAVAGWRLASAFGTDPGRAVWVGLPAPLVAVHAVSGAHHDALLAGLVLIALASTLRRPVVFALAAGAALGLAAAIKITALAALPFVLVLAFHRVPPSRALTRATRHRARDPLPAPAGRADPLPVPASRTDRLPGAPDQEDQSPGMSDRVDRLSGVPDRVDRLPAESDRADLLPASSDRPDGFWGPPDRQERPPTRPDRADGTPGGRDDDRPPVVGHRVGGVPGGRDDDLLPIVRDREDEPPVVRRDGAGLIVAARDVIVSRGVLAVVAGLAGSFALVTLVSGLGFGWLGALTSSTGPKQWTSVPTGVGMAVGYLLRAAGFGAHEETALAVSRAAGVLALGVVALTCLWGAWKHSADPRAVVLRAGVVLLAVVLLGPVAYPWYFLTPLPVLAAALTTDRHLRLLSYGGAFASLLVLPDGLGIPALTKAPGAIVDLLLVIAAAVLALRRLRRSRRSPAALPPP